MGSPPFYVGPPALKSTPGSRHSSLYETRRSSSFFLSSFSLFFYARKFTKQGRLFVARRVSQSAFHALSPDKKTGESETTCKFIPLEFPPPPLPRVRVYVCRSTRQILLSVYTNLIIQPDKTGRDNALLTADAQISDNR